LKPILALGAVCIACCALTAALPLLTGLVALPLLGSTEIAIAAVAASAALTFFLLSRRQTNGSCSSGSPCACSASNAPKMAAEDGGPPIACTLGSDALKTRIEQFRKLAERALLSVHREPLRLHLVYAPDAARDVRDLMRQEKSCCAFLDFDIRDETGGTHVTITAPEAARENAQELFALFAPDLPRHSQQQEFAAS
jgi:hypothetical protein